MHRTVSGTRAYFETNFGFTVKNASSGSGSEIAIAPERRRGFGFNGRGDLFRHELGVGHHALASVLARA
jgi:hypothetical protein